MNLGDKVKVVRDLIAEEKGIPAPYVGRVGTVIAFDDPFIDVIFPIGFDNQSGKTVSFSDVELEIVN
jgi:hypothetical protein